MNTTKNYNKLLFNLKKLKRYFFYNKSYLFISISYISISFFTKQLNINIFSIPI